MMVASIGDMHDSDLLWSCFCASLFSIFIKNFWLLCKCYQTLSLLFEAKTKQKRFNYVSTALGELVMF